MSLKDEFDAVTDVVAPELHVPTLIFKIVVGVVLAIALGWVIWKLFFADHAAAVKAQVTAARAQGLVGQAQGDAGAHAAQAVAGFGAQVEKDHEITRDHYYEITKQPGAADPVPDPVWNAFQQSVCLRRSAAGLPDCQRLQETHP